MKKTDSKYFYIGLMFLLSCWMIYIGVMVIKWKPVPMGESDDYMLTTISIEYGHNLGIDENDVQYAMHDFPEFAEYLKNCYDEGEQSTVVDKTTGRLPWYFGTYSAICIPVKIILKMIDLPQIYTYAVTNYILYLVSVLGCILLYKGNKEKKIFLSLAIAINPVVFYLVWQSAEVFMFSFVVLSLLLWNNDKYCLSALVLSIAGTMNSTVMILGVALIVDFLIKTIKKSEDAVDFLKCGLKDIIVFGCHFIPCLVPFIYYKLKYNCWNLQVSYGFASGNNQYMGRVLSYLFDWNYGILPYFPLFLLLFLVIFFISVRLKKYRFYLYALAFFGVIGSYSIMYHINCGMSGIARYSVWAAPIMIFGCFEFFSELQEKEERVLKKMNDVIVLVSIIYSFFIVNVYGVMFASNTSDIKVTPVAKVILEHAPLLYFELESSFIARVAHVPGGYQYSEPVYYYNEELVVTKILLKKGDEEKVLSNLSYGQDKKNSVESKFKSKRDLYFVTFLPSDNVLISNNIILNKYSFIADGNIELEALSKNELCYMNDGKLIIGTGGLQFGPYIELTKGKYEVVIKGTNLEKLEMGMTCNFGKNNLTELMEVSKKSETELIYSFEINKSIDAFEIINQNNSEEDVKISSIQIICK